MALPEKLNAMTANLGAEVRVALQASYDPETFSLWPGSLSAAEANKYVSAAELLGIQVGPMPQHVLLTKFAQHSTQAIVIQRFICQR